MNTKILNIFNAWKKKIVAKATFVVIFQIYVVMTWTTSCLFFVLYTCGISKYTFFGQEAQKRQYFWHLTTFHTLVVIKQWSWAWKRWSNESYGSLLHYRHVTYQNIHFFGQEAQKRQYFWHLTHFHTPCGHQIVAMTMKKVVTWILLH